MPDVLMPRLSDTMTEGVLSQWLKQAGDEVHRGDVLAEIETDKATMELEAYDEGVLERVLVPEGTTVPIGTPIAVIGDGGATADAAPLPPAEAPSAAPPSAAPAPRPAAPSAPPPPPAATTPSRLRTSPLARRIAHDHDIDLSTITGTGPGGRIVRADLDAAVAAKTGGAAHAPAAPPPAPPREAPPAPPAPSREAPAAPPQAPSAAPLTSVAPAAAGVDEGADEEVPLTAVRRVTALRLTESAATPHFHLTAVLDAGALLDFRAEINDRLAGTTGTPFSVTDLLVRAAAVTLRAHPQVNSSWAEDKILRHRRIHIGIAVAVPDGLIVPVVRDADRKSLGEIAIESRTLVARARAGRLRPEEFTGGTFTISNLGMYGIDHFTAVINPPEAALLAVGAATEEPAVRDGQVVARRTIKLTLSTDHRVLDGATAATFLRDLVATLSEPLRIVVGPSPEPAAGQPG